MNSSERTQPLRNPQQNTFVMLNRFWLLSKKPLLPLFLMDNIKLDWMPTNIKLKIQACFTLCFTFWGGTSIKSYKIQLPVLLFLVLHQLLYQQISFSCNFLELHPTLSAKHFCRKILLFWRIHPNPLNSQNLLSMTEVFSQFSLKCLLKCFFFKNLLNCYCTCILKVPTTDSLVFFSEHISRTAILTQASVIICKYNF